MAVIKTKYQSRIDVERERKVAVSKILPWFTILVKINKTTRHIRFIPNY